jgi:hypothetical protein
MPVLRKKALAVFLASTLLAGCGAQDDAASAATVDLSRLPVTVEGKIDVSVAEGDDDGNGVAEYNFGTLTVGEQAIDVLVDPEVMRKHAELADAESHVRATLGSATNEFGGGTVYRVTSIEKL